MVGSSLLLLLLLPHALSFLPAPPQAKVSRFNAPRFGTSLQLRRGGKPRGPLRTIEVKPPMNTDITAPEVRCSAPPPTGTGKDEVFGVIPLAEALSIAKERGVDLILISAGDVPVCKIVDYSKWRYMKEKKAKEVKKNSKSTEIKEVKMSYKIDVGDLEVRRKNALKFLRQGNRVKVSVQFKGREQTHVDLGFKLLETFAESEGLAEWGVMDKPKR